MALFGTEIVSKMSFIANFLGHIEMLL